MDGEEIAKAIQEYLKRKGHVVTKIKLYSEEATTNEAQPTFCAVAHTKEKKS